MSDGHLLLGERFNNPEEVTSFAKRTTNLH